ncbi:Nf-kappa-b-activating protein [Mycena sanguinolenta]|uniref:Nf-kappa-b-activating protein n=1 Tax=Mycena sanguinolenta TaxID=230812 RepID=A0A8H7D5C8_9AGAR|nr:Nf-kappa-b-activating protein [Mycena sanguinolenta]
MGSILWLSFTHLAQDWSPRTQRLIQNVLVDVLLLLAAVEVRLRAAAGVVKETGKGKDVQAQNTTTINALCLPRGPRNSYGGGGSDFMESRRAKRDATVVNIWPPSPKAPARDLSPKRSKSSKKSKRSRSYSSDDSSEEEYRRRKERKEKKRAKKDRERRSSRKHYDSDSDDTDDRSRRDRLPSRRSRSRTRHIPVSRSPSPLVDEDEDEWVVKSTAPAATALPFANGGSSPPNPSSRPVADRDGDSGEDVGPQPVSKQTTSKRIDERAYGGSLLRGEGSAMAAFLQDGTESRIPRRGEIGLTSEEIAKYEDVGYVMSGSRHRRMNAVRMRKENQVISAEEKRGILKLQKEERERREAILREEFSELVNERLKGTESRSKI